MIKSTTYDKISRLIVTPLLLLTESIQKLTFIILAERPCIQIERRYFGGFTRDETVHLLVDLTLISEWLCGVYLLLDIH